MTERSGAEQGSVLDSHAMMGLVARLQAAQNRDGFLDRRFPYIDWLEAALKGGVFFDVLAVFIQRCGADAAQIAAGQGRLEHVAG